LFTAYWQTIKLFAVFIWEKPFRLTDSDDIIPPCPVACLKGAPAVYPAPHDVFYADKTYLTRQSNQTRRLFISVSDMNQRLRIFLYFLAGIVTYTQVSAQEIVLPEKVAQQLAHNEPYFHTNELYLHIDKSVYVNNENIWFAGYLLKSAVEVNKHHSLYVVLSNSTTRKVAASDKFVMENGLSAGNIFIADSLPAGDYDLIAYTNTLTTDQPNQSFFQQRISIKSARKDVFTAELSKPLKNTKDTLLVPCKITTAESYDAKNAVVSYQVIANGKKIYETTGTTNNYGEINIKVPLLSQPAQYEWHATIKEEKKVFSVKKDISTLSDQLVINWYPEGGSLVDGLPSKVAFEALTITGKPVPLQARLISSSQDVTPIQTNTAGLGVFSFKPNKAETYSLVIDDTTYELTNFSLPTIKPAGYVIQLSNAIPKDTVTMRIFNKQMPEEVWVLVHDYKTAFSYFPLQVKNNIVQLKIPAMDMPVGLAFITLLSKEGEPLAERSLFFGQHTLPILQVKTNATQYDKRSKVTIDLQTIMPDKSPIPAVFSTAAVLYKRVDTASFQHIVPYAILNNFIQNGIIPKSRLSNLQNKEELDMFLLTRCWTNFKEIKPVNSNILAKSVRGELNTKGHVLQYQRKVKKPVEIGIFNKGGFNIITTDSSGNFIIPYEILTTLPDNKINLFINATQHKESYTIILDKQEEAVSEQVAQLHFLQHLLIKAQLPEEEKKEINKIPTLANVVVTSKDKKDQFGFTSTDYMSSFCNDYVCMNNILNCRNHPNGSPAIEGGLYSSGGKMIIYHCAHNVKKEQETFVKIKGRYFTKEFYKADYVKFSPPDPEISSTLFWQPVTITNDKGEARLEFYTNDLPGVYVCVIEGITDKGVIQQQVLFKVNNQ
jgi:hypothetical protein